MKDFINFKPSQSNTKQKRDNMEGPPSWLKHIVFGKDVSTGTCKKGLLLLVLNCLCCLLITDCIGYIKLIHISC